jgi:hypothetical protein
MQRCGAPLASDDARQSSSGVNWKSIFARWDIDRERRVRKRRTTQRRANLPPSRRRGPPSAVGPNGFRGDHEFLVHDSTSAWNFSPSARDCIFYTASFASFRLIRFSRSSEDERRPRACRGRTRQARRRYDGCCGRRRLRPEAPSGSLRNMWRRYSGSFVAGMPVISVPARAVGAIVSGAAARRSSRVSVRLGTCRTSPPITLPFPCCDPPSFHDPAARAHAAHGAPAQLSPARVEAPPATRPSPAPTIFGCVVHSTQFQNCVIIMA